MSAAGPLNALVAAPQFPEHDRESGSRRIFNMVEFFLELGWRVAFLACDGGSEGYAEDLKRLGVAVQSGLGPRTDQFIADGNFGLAVCAFWKTAERLIPRIRRRSPETRIVVDSVDLHFLRLTRERFLASREDAVAGLLDPDLAFLMIREINAYAAADAVLTVSEKEARLIGDLLGGFSESWCLPDAEDAETSRRPFSKRKGILFVGNFRHPPNLDALRYFRGEVLPLIDSRLVRAHPVWVVGNAAAQVVQKLDRTTAGLQVVGWVPSLRPYWEKARISVVPLRYGAGTKRKLIQSLMAGLPCVTTRVGTEGLDLSDGREVLLRDDPESFAEGIARLLQDQQLWTSLARRGRRWAVRRHGRRAARRRFEQILASLVNLSPKRGLDLDLSRHWIKDSYQMLVHRVRETAASFVPPRSAVAVVSRGDSELVRLQGFQTRHFPEGPDGDASWHHPADSQWAISHLETQIDEGVGYLLIPATAFWWFEYYPEWTRYLDERASLLVDRPDTCRIYQLAPTGRGAGAPRDGKGGGGL